MTTDQGKFIAQVAPNLIRQSDRFFTAQTIAEVFYPTDAQAKLAAVEETSFWFRHRNNVIHSLVRRFPPSGLIVEIGGGNGYVSRGLSQIGFESAVLEPGIKGAEIAHRRGLTVLHADFNAETFLSGSLPAIGLFDVIEHIDDARNFLTDCRHALTFGGFIYVTVPAFRTLWSSDDKFAGHFRRYSFSSLEEVLKSAGFQVLFISAFFSFLVAPLYLARSLPSLLGWRKVSSVDHAVAHHHSNSRTSNAVEWLHRWENTAIKHGYRIPLGTSLIAVARKS